MKYDELTGSYIMEETDNLVQEPGEESVSSNPENDSTKEEMPETKVPKLNKKVIMICAFALIIILFGVRILKNDKPDKESIQEKKLASDIVVPDFGDYKTRAYTGENAIEPEIVIENPLPVTEKYSSVVKKTEVPTVEKKAPVSSTVRSNPLTEEELAARKAPIKATIQQNSSLTGTNQLGSGYSIYSPTTGTMTQDEYVQSRLQGLSSLPTTSVTTYETQNMQGNKQSFYETNKDSITSGYYIAKETIWTGTIIPAVLLTGIATDNPGQVKAQVTENVYDSLTGKVLLIPQGTILIAEYNSSISYSQRRVQIAWNTLIRPDGYQLSLGNMNGVDKQGYSGATGRVDDHFFEYVKAMGIISVFTAINGEFDNQMKALQNEYAANMLQQNQNVVNQLGTKLIDRALDIQPSIFIKNGSKVNVFVNKNIALPPFKQ